MLYFVCIFYRPIYSRKGWEDFNKLSTLCRCVAVMCRALFVVCAGRAAGRAEAAIGSPGAVCPKERRLRALSSADPQLKGRGWGQALLCSAQHQDKGTPEPRKVREGELLCCAGGRALARES